MLERSGYPWDLTAWHFPHDHEKEVYKRWIEFVDNLIRVESGNREKVFNKASNEFNRRLNSEELFRNHVEKTYNSLDQAGILDHSFIRFIYDGFHLREDILLYLLFTIEINMVYH